MGLLVGFSTYVQAVTNKRLRAEEGLRKARHELEVRVEERTSDLREQREFLRQVIDTDPNLVFVKNWDGIFTLANQAVADIYGTTIEEIVGKSDADFDPNEEEVKAFLRADREVMQTLSIKYIPEETVTDARTGEVRWFQTIKVPLVSSSGESSQILGVSTEITERKRAEEDLRLRERAISASTNSILITDPNLPDNPIVYVNPAFEKTTGYTPEEVLGWNCRFLQGEDRDQPALEELRVAIQEGRECRVVLKNYKKDGTPFWNDLSLYPVRDESGHLANFVGVQNDVTERLRAEEALRESEDRLRVAVEATELGTWDFNPARGRGGLRDLPGRAAPRGPGADERDSTAGAGPCRQRRVPDRVPDGGARGRR